MHALIISNFCNPISQQDVHLYSYVLIVYDENAKNKYFLKVLVDSRSPSGEKQQSADTGNKASLWWLRSCLHGLGPHLNGRQLFLKIY